jgi:NitT/TauT family transport system substrate-binding protein
MSARLILSLALAALALLPGAPPARAAEQLPPEHIRVGVVHSLGSAPLFIAKLKGFFADEGLDAEMIFFDAAQPIALAAAAGDVDFGSTGMTAAFLTLANQGTLKIIGAGTWEHPGFQSIGFIVSNQAYAAGVKSFADMKGHSAAITQTGTPLHYDLARVLDKYHVDLASVRILPLQSNPNVASALAGGQADLGVQTAANAYAIVKKGQGRIIGWVGDELPAGQSEGTFTTTKLANNRPETVKHFMNALRKAEATWDAAFLDSSGNHNDQAGAPEMVALAAKALDQPEDIVRQGINYFDPQSRVRLADIQAAIDWYVAQGMMKGKIDAKSLVDSRYAVEAP